MTATPDHSEAADTHSQHSTEVWAKVPAWILQIGITLPALRLFIAMSAHADGKGRMCWASQTTLAEDCRWFVGGQPDRRRVQKVLAELIGIRLILPAGRHTNRDGVWSNRYLIAPFPDAVPEYALTDAASESATWQWQTHSKSDDADNLKDDADNPKDDADNLTAQSDPLDQTPETDPKPRDAEKRDFASAQESQSELLRGKSFDQQKAASRAALDALMKANSDGA